MTPMRKIFGLFIEATNSGWGQPFLALFHADKETAAAPWAGYHLWVGGRARRHFQVWPVNRRFLKTWE